MAIPQQSVPSSPLMSQPVFPVDTSGNPLVPAQESGNLASIKTDLDTMVAHLGPLHNATQAGNTAGAVVVKGSSGYLWSATVTTLGTAQLDIYDNATTGSGTKLLSIPASAPVGSIYNFINGSFAANGITSNGVLNCPAVTFQYS